MTTISIDFRQLESAARSMRYAASDMESYADGLPRRVQNPASALGGSSEMSSVASLAASKARQLRIRANAHRSLASKTEEFIDQARDIDRTVATRIESVANQNEKGLSWWGKVKYAGYKLLNGAIGSTELGAFMGTIADGVSCIKKHERAGLKDLLNWFKRGDGKFLLNIGIAILGAIGAICTAILAFPASGFLAVLVGVCAIVGAVVTAAQTYYTIKDNAKALGNNRTEPGLANYYGSTSSLSDYAKKNTTSRTKQNLAGTVDFVGAAAGVIGTVGGLGVHKSADGITKVSSLDKATVKENLMKEIGFKPGKFGGQMNDWKFSPGTLFGFGKEATEGLSGIHHGAEVIKNVVSPVEKMGKTFNTLINLDKSFDFKTVVKTMGNVLPGVSGPKDAVGVIDFASKTVTGKYW